MGKKADRRKPHSDKHRFDRDKIKAQRKHAEKLGQEAAEPVEIDTSTHINETGRIILALCGVSIALGLAAHQSGVFSSQAAENSTPPESQNGLTQIPATQQLTQTQHHSEANLVQAALYDQMQRGTVPTTIYDVSSLPHYIRGGTRVDSVKPALRVLVRTEEDQIKMSKKASKNLATKIKFVDDAGTGTKQMRSQISAVKRAFRAAIEESPEMALIFDDFLSREDTKVMIHTAKDNRQLTAMLGYPSANGGFFVLDIGPPFFESVHNASPAEEAAVQGDIIKHEMVHFGNYARGLAKGGKDRQAALKKVTTQPEVRDELEDFLKKATSKYWYEQLKFTPEQLTDLCKHTPANIRKPEFRMPPVEQLDHQQKIWAGNQIMGSFKFNSYGGIQGMRERDGDIGLYDEIIAHACQFGLSRLLPKTMEALEKEPLRGVQQTQERATGRA